MKACYACVNGTITAMDKAVVSIEDQGLLHGDGLYETIQARCGKCIRLTEHIARLHSGAAVLGLLDDIHKIDVHHAILTLLETNKLSDARIRITVTRGHCNQPTILITSDPLPAYKMETCLAVVSSHRRDETSPLSRIKSLNCLASVMAQREARAAGADDAVLLNTQGNVAEGTSANVFLVCGNQLLTPSVDQGCLPGTVRGALLKIAPKSGFAAIESVIHRDTLYQADELFFSSAVRLLRPIVQLDCKPVGSRKHTVCTQLLEALQKESSE